MKVNSMFVKIIGTFLSRGGAAFLSLISSMFIVRYLGESDAGGYFTELSFATFLSTLVSFGSNGLTLKLVSNRIGNINEIANQNLLFIIKNTVIILIILNVISFFYENNINMYFICVYGCFFSIAQSYQFMLIAKGNAGVSYFLNNWIPSLFVIYAAFFFPNYIYIYTCLGYIVSTLLLYLCLYRMKDHDRFDKEINDEFKINNRWNYLQQDILGQIYSSFVIILSSNYLSKEDISKLAIYIKLTSVCNIIISIFNMTIYHRLFQKIKVKSEYMSLYILSFLNILGVISFMLPLFYFWDYVRSYYNISIEKEYIFIVFIAYLISGFSGCSQMLLNSMGHDRVVKNISWLTFTVGIILLNYFTYTFNVLGALIALSITISLQSIMNYFYLRIYLL
ncbi:hypothetical protein PAND9192_02292 [Photobacterium andalusiense]|uniref:Polysaccharide biosynthesis protein n=2 Tax=Photobacterium andalusiense TaxID=2204296 RepID=A0A1Y6MHE2_9GAMM|nr:hypothetical protein PAND9192_02292 [Photobacterium andalusiense]